MPKANAAAAGAFTIGGDLHVNRLGFGAMRVTGEGIWGPPEDRAEAIRTLRQLPDLGINFVDTADSYGPEVSEELIHEALHPYPEDLVIGLGSIASTCGSSIVSTRGYRARSSSKRSASSAKRGWCAMSGSARSAATISAKPSTTSRS